MARDDLGVDESKPTDGDGRVLEERLGRTRIEQDPDEALGELGDVRLEGFLKGGSARSCTRSKRINRSISFPSLGCKRDQKRVEWDEQADGRHCMAISPTAQAALLQTETSSCLGFSTWSEISLTIRGRKRGRNWLRGSHEMAMSPRRAYAD
jgi:hypothetical protein